MLHTDIFSQISFVPPLLFEMWYGVFLDRNNPAEKILWYFFSFEYYTIAFLIAAALFVVRKIRNPKSDGCLYWIFVTVLIVGMPLWYFGLSVIALILVIPLAIMDMTIHHGPAGAILGLGLAGIFFSWLVGPSVAVGSIIIFILGPKR